jgi:hypothetical protein
MRSHRKYLLERFQANGLLEQSLWTNLDTDLRLVTTLPQQRWQNFNDINVIKLQFEHNGCGPYGTADWVTVVAQTV